MISLANAVFQSNKIYNIKENRKLATNFGYNRETYDKYVIDVLLKITLFQCINKYFLSFRLSRKESGKNLEEICTKKMPELPIVVVLSGSMEPAFHRGDLLFITNYKQEDIKVGEIIAFKVEGRDIPIVHRVLELHEKGDGTVKFLTKGDNNSVDDRGLYAPGQFWLTKKRHCWSCQTFFALCWNCQNYYEWISKI